MSHSSSVAKFKRDIAYDKTMKMLNRAEPPTALCGNNG